MDKRLLNWFQELIVNEVEPLITKKYTGNITLQLNLCEGGVTNANIGSSKSTKAPKANKEII